MATVCIQKRHRKKGTSYIVTFRDPASGKNVYYRTFRRKMDADQSANELRILLQTGKKPQRKKKFSAMTFKAVGEILCQSWKRRTIKGKLSAVTFEGYCHRLQVLGRVFGPRLLSEITEDEILDFQTRRADEFSNASANRDLFILKQVFKAALDMGAISEDFVSPITYEGEKKHERNSYLLPDALKKLLAVSREGRAKHYLPALILLGAEHGASIQEAIDLEWSDIDFEFKGKGLIRFFRTKNDRERTEILMPRTREALIAWREHQDRVRQRKKIHPTGDRIFCRMDGTPIKRVDSAWRAARTQAGMKDFHFHDLRHTFCSNALLAGASLKDVKEMIGHSDLSMTDRYSHLPSFRRRALLEELARHYEGNGQVGVLEEDELATHLPYKG